MAGQQPNRPVKGDKEYAHGFKIDGFIETGDSFNDDTYMDAFIEMIEAKNWTFGGMTEFEVEEMEYDPNHDPEAPLNEEESDRKTAILMEEYRQERIKECTEYLTSQGFKVVTE